jgi:hypothetical protein
VIVDGAAASSAGIQVVGAFACRIAVAASAPAVGSNNFFVLNPDAIDQIVNMTLGAGNVIYGQALSGTAYVRGFATA